MKKKTLITKIRPVLISLLLLIIALVFSGCTFGNNTKVTVASKNTTYIATVTTTSPENTEEITTVSSGADETKSAVTVEETTSVDVTTLYETTTETPVTSSVNTTSVITEVETTSPDTTEEITTKDDSTAETSVEQTTITITTSPEVTTKNPETTKSPETTKKPATTTSPVVTTSKPVETTAPVETRAMPEFNNPLEYASDKAYNNLDNYENAANMKALYNQISSAAMEFVFGNKDCDSKLEHADATLANIIPNYSEYAIAFEVQLDKTILTQDDIITVWASFRNDNPFYYWIGADFTYYESKNIGYLPILVSAKYSQATVRNALTQKIIDECKEVYETLAVKSDYKTALAVHNLICQNIEYKNVPDSSGILVPDSSFDSHSVSGYFDRLNGVCECYSKTFMLFMNCFDIDCYFVINNGHAYNLLKVDDGNWYWVDVTHDDTSVESKILTVYFCKNDTENIWKGSGYGKPSSFTDSTFLGSTAHTILPAGDCSYIYEGYTYRDWGLFYILELPARSTVKYKP